MKLPRKPLVAVSLLYLWWLVLSSRYLFKFWAGPLVGGADGSGHVAVLHLYALHVYPGLQGWIPELFGGMPFPVYYPPLFYWTGATIMWLTGGDASFAAKLLITLSFAALPGALYELGRRIGLTSTDAVIAAAAAAVVACGSNVVSLSGIGLLGLFEVGLFTQTLGFVFFCLWAGFLPHARRSPRAAAGAILCLAATVLTNAHIWPLVACYVLAWALISLLQTVKSRRRVFVSRVTFQILSVSCLLLGSVLISGIWLLPLIKWYSYSVGQPLPSSGLFSSLGSLNIVWPLCAIVCWTERKRRGHVSVLCAALLLTALVSLTSLGAQLKYIPFQPARVISGALLLSTIPVTLIISRMLTEIAGGQKRVAHVSLTLCILALAWLHPMQAFGIGSLTENEAAEIEEVRSAVRKLPPGKVLVELVEPTAIFNSSDIRTREFATARALPHQIARDGRAVLWTVFREQSPVAPIATAISNLFSTSKESFGLGGLGLQRSIQEDVSTEQRLLMASYFGVTFFLIRTPTQTDALKNSSGARLLWRINGWSLFTSQIRPAVSTDPIDTTPVLAWLPAKFKSRGPGDVDLFNLGEQLAFAGRPDILPLWAQSENVDVWDFISKVPGVTVVIDPNSAPQAEDQWIASLNKEGTKLRVILLDNGSRLSARIYEQCRNFRGCARVQAGQYAASGSDVIRDLADELIKTEGDSPMPANREWRLWRSTSGYFPAWRTDNGQFTLLTGQGTVAILSSLQPSLRLDILRVRVISWAVCLLGLTISAGYVNHLLKRVRVHRAVPGSPPFARPP